MLFCKARVKKFSTSQTSLDEELMADTKTAAKENRNSDKSTQDLIFGRSRM